MAAHNSRVANNLAAAALTASAITIGIGCVTFVGRTFGLKPSTALFSDLLETSPGTALGFLLSGVALALLCNQSTSRWARWISRGFSLAVIAAAVIGLAQWLGGRVLIANWLRAAAPATSLGLLLAGFALLLLDFETIGGKRPAHRLSWAVFLVALLGTLGSGSSAASRSAEESSGVGLHGALALALLSAGVVCARPKGGLIGLALGNAVERSPARRLLAGAIVGPAVAGLLVIFGLWTGSYNTPFAVGLLTSISIIISLAVLWRGSELLQTVDSHRAFRSSEPEDEPEPPEPRMVTRKAQPAMSGRGRNEVELEDFFENAAVALRWLGRDGTILRANRAELALLGYPADEYIGHNIAEFHVDPKLSDEMLERLRRGETINDWQASLRAKDGSPRDVVIDSNVLWKSGEFVHTRCFTRDITQLRRAEAARSEELASEQAARARAEESVELVRRLQTIVDVSLMRLPLDELLRQLLVRIRELLGADASAVLLLGADGRGLVPRAVAGSDATVAEELHGSKGQGIALRIAASRAPLLINDLAGIDVVGSTLFDNIRSLMGAPLMIEAEIIGVIYAVASDANRFKETDLALLQLVADRVALAIEHARLYEAEQQARISAEAANRMKDEFLATVSHELRSPLNAILGWMKLLRAGRLDEEAAGHALETVERSAKTQSRIISDLLDVSRIISGKLLLKVRPIEPVRVIEAAVEAVRPAAVAKGIRLETSLDPSAGPISGDADRLQQIVWNLLSNAIKFTSSGGLVEVSLKSTGPHAEIEVRDSGIGIRPDFLPYVFDRFRQGDASSSRRQGGLGLGLAIVRHLVELHGGTVAVHSEGEGKGSSFVVELPRALGQVGSTGARANRRWSDEFPAYAAPQLSGLKVLVVDDDSDARELMTVVLKQASADVRAVASAPEALELMSARSEWAPDVLVSDIEMPGIDGYSLIRRIRALEPEQGGRIPAVAVTAYSRVEDRMRALAAGFQLHIAKPVEPGELLTVLASLSGKSAKSRWSNASKA